jgi:predicted secreted protein
VPELELRVGDVHELELRGLGSAGYSWQTELTGPEGLLQIERAGSGPPATPTPAGSPPVGGSLPELFRLVALGEGRVHLRLTLRRSWETGNPPIEEDELDVIVSA